MLGNEPRAPCLLDRRSTTELRPQPRIAHSYSSDHPQTVISCGLSAMNVLMGYKTWGRLPNDVSFLIKSGLSQTHACFMK
jgi:hypothetical protein